MPIAQGPPPSDDRLAAAAPAAIGKQFPTGFLWGAATAGHQVEGNNLKSDLWLLEHLTPTVFAEPSGDACNSLELWRQDLDLLENLGLNSYRFSLEWARIEPEEGMFSLAMLDHYKAIIEACVARSLTPLVTFNHCTTPRWFAERGGWTSSDSPDLFARFCERAARHLATHIGYAATLNEPNGLIFAGMNMPAAVASQSREMLAAAARHAGVSIYRAGNTPIPEDIPTMTKNLLVGHRMGRLAIKAVRPDLPVGVCLAIGDDEAVGSGSKRDAMRAELYGAWLDAARGDDFVGVQNYERTLWGPQEKLPPPTGATLGSMGGEIYPPSLAGAVRYAHEQTGIPIIVTENGVNTTNDAIRAAYIPAVLHELQQAISDGVPVKGYFHWSLLDNFEWVFGYTPRYGLYSVDRTTFVRTPKPSAGVLGAIARQNRVLPQHAGFHVPSTLEPDPTAPKATAQP